MQKTIFSIALIIGMIIMIVPVESQDSASVLLLYGETNDKTGIEHLLDGYNIQLDSIEIDNVQPTDIDDQDLIIFVSAEEFDLEDDVETIMENYLQDENHHLIMLTPHIEEFSDDLEITLGVESNDETTENETQQWIMAFNQNFGNYSTGENITYTGITTLVELTDDAQLIASFTSASGNSSDIEDYELPRPALWNVTRKASITVIPMVASLEVGLHLSQIPFPLTVLISNLLQKILSNIDTIQDTGNTDTTSSNTPETSGNVNLPSLIFSLDMLNVLMVFIVLILMQVMGVLRWIVERLSIGIVFVIGAFYNISDRTLSHNEVIMHNVRADILVFLNHVGSFGAHLREIKNVTGLGTGSLLWHLQMLEDYGYIDKYNIGKYTVFVTENHTLDSQMKVIELDLQSKYIVDLLNALINDSGQSILVSDVADTTGIAQRALRRLFSKLEHHNVVEIEKYPQMAIRILDINMLRRLYQSLDLRGTFSLDQNIPEIQHYS